VNPSLGQLRAFVRHSSAPPATSVHIMAIQIDQ
jgi:hypothetical protein